MDKIKKLVSGTDADIIIAYEILKTEYNELETVSILWYFQCKFVYLSSITQSITTLSLFDEMCGDYIHSWKKDEINFTIDRLKSIGKLK